MSDAFTIDTYGHVVRVTFNPEAVITPDLVIRAMDRENQLYEVEGRYDLWNFQGCMPSEEFGYDAVSQIIEHIENRYGEHWSVKTALLVEETVQVGLSRMFQILLDEAPTNIGIFQDKAAALAWLNPDDNQ